MTLYANNRAWLIEQILRIPLQDWKGGVVDSGSTVTAVDDEREEPEDYFQNTTPVSKIRIVSTTDNAAPKGETRRISDFTLSTGTITISSDKAFSVAPAAGDTYAILSEYDWDEIAAAINMIIDSLTEKALIYKVDETVEMQDDTYEYAIPDGFVTIHRLSQADDNGNFPNIISPDQYRIIHGAVPKICFNRTDASQIPEGHWIGNTWVEDYLDDGKKLRIEGYGKQARLTTDDSICYLNPNYVIYKAAALALGARIRAQDADAFKVRRDECEKQAEIFSKELCMTSFPPDTKWSN